MRTSEFPDFLNQYPTVKLRLLKVVAIDELVKRIENRHFLIVNTE